MEQIETIFQLDDIELTVKNDDPPKLYAIAREINTEEAGRLHPQPVKLLFALSTDRIGGAYCDIRDIQQNGYELRCSGAFDSRDSDALYDDFRVNAFEVAHDYDGDPDVPDNTHEEDFSEEASIDHQDMEMTL